MRSALVSFSVAALSVISVVLSAIIQNIAVLRLAAVVMQSSRVSFFRRFQKWLAVDLLVAILVALLLAGVALVVCLQGVRVKAQVFGSVIECNCGP